MKKSSNELVYTGVSIGIMVLIFTIIMANMEGMEAFLEVKVKSRWIGY